MKLASRGLGLLPRRPARAPDPAMTAALRDARERWGEVTEWSIHPLALAAVPGLVGDQVPITRSAGTRSRPHPQAGTREAKDGGGPLLILECGSGFSTVVLHEWARRRAARTRLVTFEHQPRQISRLAGLLDGEATASIHPSPLGQVTEATFRRMLAAPSQTRTIWRERADPLPEDLYEQTRITRAFYDRLLEEPPVPADGERLLVILDGPNGSGRSIVFPLLAPLLRDESFWLIDDWDHYPFLPEMAAVFEILEEQTAGIGNKRWKLVRARRR